MKFDLGTVLSVTTGYNLAPRSFGDVCVLLDYMTGENLTDLGRVAMRDRCAKALLAQFPTLAGVEPPSDAGPRLLGWLTEQRARIGDAFDVLPLAGPKV